MVIDFLANKTIYVSDVTNMIYNEFTVNTNSKRTFDDVKTYFSNIKKDSLPITLIALDGEECIGTISIVENDLKNQDTYKPWLASLYTKPEHRNKGVGQRLITETLNVAKDFGYEELYLRTETASEYYQDRGWSFVGNTIDEKNEKTGVFKMKLR